MDSDGQGIQVSFAGACVAEREGLLLQFESVMKIVRGSVRRFGARCSDSLRIEPEKGGLTKERETGKGIRGLLPLGERYKGWSSDSSSED